MVVELSPGLNHHPGLPQITKPLPVQALIPYFAVEALDKTVMPRLARQAGFRLPQEADDLPFRESLLHVQSP